MIAGLLLHGTIASFAALDTDGSGMIEDHELLVHMNTKGQSSAQIETHFRALDVNKDGHISRDEWARRRTARRWRRSTRRVARPS